MTPAVSFDWDPPEQPLLLPEEGPIPPDGSSWFFLAALSRTGSSVAARLLNLHPKVRCTSEDNALPTLSTVMRSKFIRANGGCGMIHRQCHQDLTPSQLRVLMEAWRFTRDCSSPMYGDKSYYYLPLAPMCRQVFPGCKFLYSYRHPLDQLSSLHAQPWSGEWPEEPEVLLPCLGAKLRNIVMQHVSWLYGGGQDCQRLEFEELAQPESARLVLAEAFEHIGVDPDEYPWDEGLAMCKHAQAIGRWKQDPAMGGIVNWVHDHDPELVHYIRLDYQFPDPE